MNSGANFRVPIKRGPKLGPEHNSWFWNPNHPSVRFAPADFMTKLLSIGEELSATWDPIKERWLIWAKAPRVNHPICRGWKLLFVNQEPDKSYLPLDERVFARLYAASVHEHGSALKYFDRIVAEMKRDKEKRFEKDRQDLIDASMPSWEHSQIKVSGFGKSSGSKFATYHS